MLANDYVNDRLFINSLMCNFLRKGGFGGISPKLEKILKLYIQNGAFSGIRLAVMSHFD